MNKIWKYLVMISFIVILDQLTKATVQSNFELGESVPVIPGFFNFTFVKNPGAAFGFGANAHDIFRLIAFKVIPVGACFWLLSLIWQTRTQIFILPLSYSLILAGAIGNLIDRFYFGYVVDFFDFYYSSYHFPAFNIADSCITIAAILLSVFFIFFEKKYNQEIKNENSSAV